MLIFKSFSFFEVLFVRKYNVPLCFFYATFLEIVANQPMNADFRGYGTGEIDEKQRKRAT